MAVTSRYKFVEFKMVAESLGKLTRGQLERRLSQQLQKLYREQLGHTPGKISCQLLKDKLTIIVEDSLTQPEQLLLKDAEKLALVEEVRADLDEVVRTGITNLAEEILDRKVIDLMSDTTLETGRTGVLVLIDA